MRLTQAYMRTYMRRNQTIVLTQTFSVQCYNDYLQVIFYCYFVQDDQAFKFA